ncbi:MAG TPA: hypothetical protein VK070_13295 [Acidimicrobiia bacterium]|nr:hypothetical protein [Acidimicrobiia bacterium]
MLIEGCRGYRVEARHANSHRLRWRGLMWRDPFPLLLETRSVHGFGLRAPIQVVSIGPDGTVQAVERLDRRRIAWFPRARWILELPIDNPVPGVGERLAFSASPGEAGSDDFHPVRMCDSHRQPG